MENNPEGQEPQKTPEDVVQISPAELAELRKKAEVSEQNFARLKKEEQARKELEARLSETGNQSFDPAKLKQEVEEKVDLRMKGHSPEIIAEIEAYAKGRGVSLTEAEKSPFIQSAVEALKAKENSLNNTPSPSSKIPVFNGKPITEVFKTGSDAEKQAAFQARMKGVKE